MVEMGTPPYSWQVMRQVIVKGDSGKFRQSILVGSHVLHADEPTELGGEDSGPEPHEFLLAALGACTAMTLKMYAERKGMPLTDVRVELRGDRTADAFVIHRTVHLEGTLTDEQRANLLAIAEKCPVHKTLRGTIEIQSQLA
jgi:putative redox protein